MIVCRKGRHVRRTPTSAPEIPAVSFRAMDFVGVPR